MPKHHPRRASRGVRTATEAAGGRPRGTQAEDQEAHGAEANQGLPRASTSTAIHSGVPFDPAMLEQLQAALTASQYFNNRAAAGCVCVNSYLH